MKNAWYGESDWKLDDGVTFPFKAPCDAEEVLDVISDMRYGAKAVYTNLYLSNQKIDRWIKKQRLLYWNDAESVFLFHKRRDYIQVYFLSKNIASFESFLCEKLSKWKANFVLDVIYHESDYKAQQIKSLIVKYGFRLHIHMMRMARVNYGVQSAELNGIEFAAPKDAQEILEIMEDFDPVDAQIPDVDEVEEAAVAKDIIVARADQKIAALFWTEHQGKTAFFRYWIARPEYRAIGENGKFPYGYYVYNQTLKREANARRMILWVREDNDVIKIHERKGFRFDGLMDDVFLKPRD